MMFDKYAMPIEKPSNGQYLCKSITDLKHPFVGVELQDSNSNLIYAVMIPSDETYHNFINEKVEVAFRSEIVGNINCLYINNFTRLKEVALVPKENLFKFYLSSPPKIDTDIVFDDIELHETVKVAKVYCIKHTYESSKKSYWSELRLMDRNRKIAIGRLFKPDNCEAKFSGKYIVVEMTKTKYGFTINFISPRTIDVEAINPLVQIAKEYILKFIPMLSDRLQEFIRQSDFINFLEKRIPDEDLEVGFNLVQIALGLALSEPYKNIIENINCKLIQEALILKKAYLLVNNEKYNNDVKNILALAKYGGFGSEDITHLITTNPGKVMLEHMILDSIENIVDTILLASINENIL